MGRHTIEGSTRIAQETFRSVCTGDCTHPLCTHSCTLFGLVCAHVLKTCKKLHPTLVSFVKPSNGVTCLVSRIQDAARRDWFHMYVFTYYHAFSRIVPTIHTTCVEQDS